MHLLYVDDAGHTGTDYDNPQQPLFSLAGIAVSEEKWFQINDRIEKRKKSLFPEYECVEIHTGDIYQGVIDRKHGYDFRVRGMEKNFVALESIADLLVELSLPLFCFVVRKAFLKDYCKRHYSGLLKIDPYLIALPYILSFFDSYLNTHRSRGIVFLDEQQSICTRLDDTLNKLRLFSNGNDHLHMNHIIERAMFVESCKSNFVQMADFCNFYINRHNSFNHGITARPDKQEHIERIYGKIERLIMPPPFDPYKKTDAFRFFDDNRDLLSNR